MNNFDSDGPSDNEWDERGELAWNEFDWERYLRDQDDVVHRYLAFYEQLKHRSDRIDEVAHLMGWDEDEWTTESGSETDEEESGAPEPTVSSTHELSDCDAEPYTLHKNPIFVATKAIYLSLKHAWERIAADPTKVPQRVAIAHHASLYRGEEQAMLAIQALDFGDYAMAISLFKRALRELNTCFTHLTENEAAVSRAVQIYREDALMRLFDLREIWLRVMNECRGELQRPVDDDDSESHR